MPSASLSNLVWFAICVLAVYRLALLVSSDEGPYLPIGPLRNDDQWGVLKQIRVLAGVYDYGPMPDRFGQPQPATNLARGLSCPLCVGLYAALLVMLLAWFDWTPTNVLLFWLGVTGAQCYLERRSGAL